jgi:dipeptidyl aminopeptidase/acylaminoacyl peptidase
MSRFVFCTLILAGGMAWSQDTGLRGPASGVLFDAPSQAIRIVNGIPGAAYLGPALLSGVGHAFVAPDGNAALVEQEGAWHLVTDLRGESPVWTPAPGLQSVPRLAAWTPDSSAAVFLDQQAGQIRILRTGDASLSSIETARLEGGIVALAVSPDARTVYAATAREDDSGAVYRSGEDSTWTLMTATKGAAVLALSAKGDVLYAGDRQSGELFEFRQPAGDGGFAPEVYSAGGPETPILALQLSRDGRKLLVARGGDSP